MSIRQLIAVTATLIVALGGHRVWAQADVVPAGGGVTNSTGSLDVTYGQATCIYATNDGGRYYVGQGVQQPYCPTVYDTVEGEVCAGSRYTDHGFDIVPSDTRTAGIRFFDLHSSTESGCDSVLTLALTIHPVYAIREPVVACDYYIGSDTIYRESTGVKTNLTTIHGCDSIEDFSLTIVHASVSYHEEVFYGATSWNGHPITAPGIYTDTLWGASANGCDSIIAIDFKEGHVVAPIIYAFSNRLLMVDHYPNGEEQGRVDFSAYRWYRNEALLEGSTRDNYYELRNGKYQYLAGCYYVEVPAVAGSTVWIRSNVLCINPDYAEWPLTLGLYPNPANTGTSVTAEVSDNAHGGQLTVYDTYGRLLTTTTVEAARFVIPLRFAAGTYTIQLQGTTGETVTKKLVVH